MKAWQISNKVVLEAKLTICEEEETDWTMDELQAHEIGKITVMWKSVAPGSKAPSTLIAGAVQDVENLGRNVEKAEVLLQKGYEALERNDYGELIKITSQIYYELNNAPIDPGSSYWKYRIYDSWNEFQKSVAWPQAVKIDSNEEKLYKKVYMGWLAQICAGAFGTALEGYHRLTIKDHFKSIDGYLKKPSTYNDDITYELAFLAALEAKGKNLTSRDIAESWVALVPYGWSAEDVALRNLMLGIYPPESGYRSNPYREWIGAQMRGAVCGMVAPGNPYLAAKLAWMDGEVSHHNNGIIGEVFNAVMTSLAFVERDVRIILQKTIAMLPDDSEYKAAVQFALDVCKKYDNYEEALIACEKQFYQYNLVHAYPNAAIEVVALWYGNNDFDKTMEITAMAGLDVDCNAAQIGSILGITHWDEGINEKWTKPIGQEMKTYVRGYEHLTIDELTKITLRCMKGFNE